MDEKGFSIDDRVLVAWSQTLSYLETLWKVRPRMKEAFRVALYTAEQVGENPREVFLYFFHDTLPQFMEIYLDMAKERKLLTPATQRRAAEYLCEKAGDSDVFFLQYFSVARRYGLDKVKGFDEMAQTAILKRARTILGRKDEGLVRLMDKYNVPPVT